MHAATWLRIATSALAATLRLGCGDDGGHAEIVLTSQEQHVIHVYGWSW